MVIPRVLQIKITPPRRTNRILPRPDVNIALMQALDYRLTLLHAGAGYGKSTALAALNESEVPVIWYQASEEDADPVVFLLHLCHATQRSLPEIANLPTKRVESWDGARGPLPAMDILDQYINVLTEGLDEPVLLILDDAHLVIDVPEIALLLDRLIGLAPIPLHLILSSRSVIRLPNLSRWRSRGEVLTVDQSVLSFSPEEIEQLFTDHYNYAITDLEAQTLSSVTEGWAITLNLFWQGLRSGAVASVEEIASRPLGSSENLFEYLAQEVMERQPTDVQEFLQTTSILQWMTPEACDHLRGVSDSKSILAFLRRQELFVTDQDEEGLRYHNIFHQFLRQQLPEEKCQPLNRSAADYYQKNGLYDLAIYHLMQARDFAQMADLLITYGSRLQSEGRLDSLATYLDALPPEVLSEYPILLFQLGDLARLHSRFQEALGWYQQAEAIWRERGQMENVGRALRGQARVYLDTVDPSPAEDLLQEALRISDRITDRETKARLYELLSENKLNIGKLEEAEQLRAQAKMLREEGPADEQLQFRVLLRTGRLDEALEKLIERAALEEENPVQTPRGHRETQLLLSIIYSMRGEGEKALITARLGMARGKDLNSPFAIAVAHMRQGHAMMLIPGEAQHKTALIEFQTAIEISRQLSIPRIRVEASWGLCRTYGYQGDLMQAQEFAEEGLKSAKQFGDEWVASLLRLSMGASFVMGERCENAETWLEQASRGFEECSDAFGATATRLWMAYSLFRRSEADVLRPVLSEVLSNCHQHAYDYLFTRPSLLGVPDERLLIPLLIYARENGIEQKYVEKLLGEINVSGVMQHPGFQLKVQTLGAFRVWRGDQLVPSNGWRREKTRHLFQLLITNYKAPLDREKIIEHLWPGSDPDTAQRNFKVVLSTLLNVLEPEREPGSESSFITRDGTVYVLRPHADIWLDIDAFAEKIRQAEGRITTHRGEAITLFEEAIMLYEGDFLPDARYETWAAAEREHLGVLFLQTADKLCELYLDDKRSDDTINLCQKILNQDNCWERAYRHLMLAYDQLGDHGQVARAYRRCWESLGQELDIQPTKETIDLYRDLTG